MFFSCLAHLSVKSTWDLLRSSGGRLAGAAVLTLLGTGQVLRLKGRDLHSRIDPSFSSGQRGKAPLLQLLPGR